MSARKIISIVLLVGSLALGYMGIDKIKDNDASVKILDLRIDVSNETAKQKGYILFKFRHLLYLRVEYTV